MSLNRHATRRDANEPDIIRALVKVGAHVEQLDEPVDLLVGWGQRFVLLEVKDPAKPPSARRLTDGQAKFIARARALGLPATVVQTAEEALQAIGAIR
jgi:hypothetical protein